MLYLPFRFARKYRDHRASSIIFLIVGTAICFFYRFELKGETNSSPQIENIHFPIQKKWGTISTLPKGLKLNLSDLESKDNILIPRMNNRIKTIYFAHDPENSPLILKPGIHEWEIQLPDTKRQQPLTVIIEFKEPPYLPVKSKVVQQNQNQALILDAKDVIVHGKQLRYEPQPHKNTIGYWANENDWCEWKLNLTSTGVFDVFILQGCGKNQGGSDVKLAVGKHNLEFTVEDTGHFQNFKERHIGTIKINQTGTQSLVLKPLRKVRNAVMDVRQIRLIKQ